MLFKIALPILLVPSVINEFSKIFDTHLLYICMTHVFNFLKLYFGRHKELSMTCPTWSFLHSALQILQSHSYIMIAFLHSIQIMLSIIWLLQLSNNTCLKDKSEKNLSVS